uniref:Uncharacterized protein n=1 Tax=Urocitellus parryii TaxID=9999 RepID=A0A8D2HEH9_UROPR
NIRSGTWLWLCPGLCSLLIRQTEAPSPVESQEWNQPYAVLCCPNLVLVGTIFSILLLTIILWHFVATSPFSIGDSQASKFCDKFWEQNKLYCTWANGEVGIRTSNCLVQTVGKC